MLRLGSETRSFEVPIVPLHGVKGEGKFTDWVSETSAIFNICHDSMSGDSNGLLNERALGAAVSKGSRYPSLFP